MRKEYDVIIVGAGPAGSMAARFAAEQGVSVLMLEKDRDVGYPVRCGEAISKKGVENFIEPDERWITAYITKFSLNAPDGNEALIEFDDSGYVLERRIFDYELAKTAANAGAEILTRAYVNGLIIEEDRVAGVKYEFQGEQKEIKSKIVIGADGVESRVGRWAGIETYVDFRDMECCTQITASNIPLDQNTLYFYFGKDYAPGGYFWIFPKGKNIANIGLGVSGMVGKKRSAQSFLNQEIYNRLKNGIYNFSDEKFNKIAESFNKVPKNKRTLGRIFVTALINQPSLLADVAKVFII
ncbi:MAG: NAD(P)/FAD-dependent oxidoreductase [Ignavibacteriaceae bacterium]